MPVTLITAGLLGLLFFWLSTRVISLRQSEQVSLGTGGNDLLERRIRGHGNFAEYAPFGVVLIGLQEMNGMPVLVVSGIAILLVTGRCLHAYALASEVRRLRARIAGMGLTFAALILGSVGCLALAFL